MQAAQHTLEKELKLESLEKKLESRPTKDDVKKKKLKKIYFLPLFFFVFKKMTKNGLLVEGDENSVPSQELDDLRGQLGDLKLENE